MAERLSCYEASDLALMPHRVHLNVPRESSVMGQIKAMRDWLQHDDQAGDFMWEYNNDADPARLSLEMGFSDENTAFHFKIKFA